jgi:hypothetical protein
MRLTPHPGFGMETVQARWKRMDRWWGGSVKKNEDFEDFSVDLLQIAGFMLNQRENDRSSSP